MKYFKYLNYVIRHRWFVFLECCKAGIIWLGIIHDLSKFLPGEFIPYANYFYGKKSDIRKGRDKTGYYKAGDTGNKAFDFAWLLHQKRNRHHWQWWILPEDDGGIKILEMTEIALKEMICDWKGAGRAQRNNVGPKKWYLANEDKIKLHPTSRHWIKRELGIE